MLPSQRQAAAGRKEELERLLRNFDADTWPEFSEAIKAFLVGVGYDDPSLMRSGVESILDAVSAFVQKQIRWALATPGSMRSLVHDVWELLNEIACEDFDSIGRQLESSFDKVLNRFSGLAELVQELEARGRDVENAASFRAAMEEIRGLKSGVLEDWPWRDGALPPVNREMIAASMAAIARNEGEPIEELIRRLGGTPCKEP